MKCRLKKGNVKIKNATKTEFDGIKFDSKLELYTYNKLKENEIKAEYAPFSFTLVPPFIYNEEKVRAMTYKPDFVGESFIIECKGFPNDSFPLRWKMFKYSLLNNNLSYDLYWVRNPKEVDEMIIKIKDNESRCRNSGTV